jgi:hypothetical protein
MICQFSSPIMSSNESYCVNLTSKLKKEKKLQPLQVDKKEITFEMYLSDVVDKNISSHNSKLMPFVQREQY